MCGMYEIYDDSLDNIRDMWSIVLRQVMVHTYSAWNIFNMATVRKFEILSDMFNVLGILKKWR
jgi:hypothetical protein